MNLVESGGHILRQTHGDGDAETPAAVVVPAESPILLTDKDLRALMGIGETAFYELLRAPWMPTPIMLGPKTRRWHRGELLAALEQRAPRASKLAEPAQLLRGKIERMKAAGSAGAAA